MSQPTYGVQDRHGEFDKDSGHFREKANEALQETASLNTELAQARLAGSFLRAPNRPVITWAILAVPFYTCNPRRSIRAISVPAILELSNVEYAFPASL